MFRQVVRQLPEPYEPLPEAKVDLISDFVEARLRIAALADLLAQEIERSREYRTTRKEVLPLSRQIDATTALSHRIADKLGLKGV